MMIEVANLTRFYGEFSALQDVSFSVEAGEIIGLLGLNGAGKSTTLKILAGLIPPSAGSVSIDGVDLVAQPEAVTPKIGYLPEDPPLYTDMTVAAFVAYIGRLNGMSADAVKARLPGVLETVQLTDRSEQIIGTLSHGYRKRVGIAQAIIHDPRLVILDEPISGLDPVQIVGMRDVIRNLASDRAVLVSSHILSEIEQTCDRIIVLRDGQLVAQGTEEELTSNMGRTTLELTLRDATGALDAWLAARQDIVEVLSKKTQEDQLTQITVVLAEDNREQLVADLVSAGFGLRRMEAASDALESIFLGLTHSREA